MDSAIKRIRVHPGIGIARVGNSDEFFIGPESPGEIADPGGTGGYGPKGGRYRDDSMRLKRQAQRFRIYAYDENDQVISELNADNVQSVSWRVHVRNMKAANYAFQGAYLFDHTKLRNPSIQGPAKPGETVNPDDRRDLIIDPGSQRISSSDRQPRILAGDVFTGIEKGRLSGYLAFEGCVPQNREEEVEVTYEPALGIEIGQLHLDESDRLLFVAGPGLAKCVTTPKVALSNPSEHFEPPNGPDPGDPLINQFAYFNVPGWWDDTCGGEIDATVRLEDGTIMSTRDNVTEIDDEGDRNAHNGGWVVTAPPKFAPDMYHVVSLKDRVFEAFPEADPNWNKTTEFYRDIFPILSRAVNYGWVSAEAAGVTAANRNLAHGPGQAGNLLNKDNLDQFKDNGVQSARVRQQIYKLMRHADKGSLLETLPPPPPAVAIPPTDSQRVSRGNQMPKLWGTGGKPLQNIQLGNNLPNQYLSLTVNDLKRMKDWADGNFITNKQPVDPGPLEDLPLSERPLAMDCAALEPTIGGGFHPGIEFPYLIVYRKKFAEAFRVAKGTSPGSVAAYMSCPWHGDFWSCNTAWWPVQRPEIVFNYNEQNGTRTYKEWFRGYDSHGKPLSSSDGYDQMVYAWSKLGMVLPKRDPETHGIIKQNGSVVFEEQDRDDSLGKRQAQPAEKDSDCPQ